MPNTLIEPAELRIGNWINYKGNPIRVYTITFIEQENQRQVWTYGGAEANVPVYQEDYSGIPVTGEVLLKCGFTAIDGNYEIVTDSTKSVVQKLLFFSESSNELFDSVIIHQKAIAQNTSAKVLVLPKIDYLHQLQNLYFSLTGEELQVNF